MASPAGMAARWPTLIGGVGAGYALVGGGISLAGWVFGVYRLTDWPGNGISIKTNPSLATMAAGLALLLHMFAGPAWRVVVRVVGAAVALLAAFTLVEHATGINLGIDTFLYTEPGGTRATAAPNRMGVPASTSFLFIGIALVLLTGGARSRRVVPTLGFVVLGITGLSLLGGLFRVEAAYTIPQLTGIAFQTSSMLWGLGLVLIVCVREHSPMRLLLDSGTAGVLLRRAAPLAIVLPLGLAYLSTVGENRGYYDTATWRALLVLALIITITWLVFWCGEVIRCRETQAVSAEHDHAARNAALAHLESEARARVEAVIDALAEPLAIYGVHGEVVRSNPAFRALHRLPLPLAETSPLPEVGMKDAPALYHTFDRASREIPSGQWPISRALAGESVRGLEMRVSRPGQGWSFIGLFNAEPLRSAQGLVTGAVLTVEDVTTRRLAEDIHRQQYAILSALFAQAPVGVYVVDDQFRFQEVNTIAARVFESVPALIGRDFIEVLRIVWGAEIGAEVARIFLHTLHTGERYISPRFVHTRHDLGMKQAYDWETQRITLPDGRFGVVCYFTDVTEAERAAAALRESEERTRLATHATGVGIREWEVATGRIRWSDQMFHMYGMEPTDDGFVDYKQWRSAVHPEDVDTQEAALEQTLRGAGPGQREFRIIRSDGKVRHIRAVDTVRRGPDGAVRSIIGTCLDITSEREAAMLLEERVRERAVELEQAHTALRRSERLAAIGTLAAGLGHDLGNLMMPLWMHLDMLERKALPSGASEEISGMRDGLKYLQRLSGSLRQMAADPDAPPPPGGTALPLWWEEIEGMVRASLPKGVRLSAQIAPGLPPVNAGLAPLTQAVFNLVQNAGEALSQIESPPGGRAITIDARASTANAGWVELSVTDNGPGMTPEVIARCFEAYFSTKGRAVSTGLGLALVRGVAEAAGGTVACHSTPGKGATFLLHLPAAPGMGGGAPLAAALDIREPRMAALATLLLQTMGVEVKIAGEKSPTDVALWITDPRPVGELAAFISSERGADSPARGRAAVVLDDPENLPTPLPHGGIVSIGRSPAAVVLRSGLMKAIALARAARQE